jgi:hypothetical protein
MDMISSTIFLPVNAKFILIFDVNGGLLAPIIQLSFKENRTFYSTTTGLTYQIPDQAEIMEYPQSSLSKGLNIVRNISEYQHVAYSYHNFGFGFFGLFGFTFSHEAGDVKNILKDGTNVVYIAYKQFQFFGIQLLFLFSSSNISFRRHSHMAPLCSQSKGQLL